MEIKQSRAWVSILVEKDVIKEQGVSQKHNDRNKSVHFPKPTTQVSFHINLK